MKHTLLTTTLVTGALFAIPCPCPQEPPACPEELFRKDECALGITGEFLWWTVEEGSLDYALKARDSLPASTTVNQNGNYEIAKFDWEPGVRASIYYFNAPKGWELKGQYTWLHADGTNTSSGRTPDRPLTSTFDDALSDTIIRARSNIDIHYNVADLLVSRVFLFEDNPHLRLKFIGGLTATWIDQDWTVNYTTDGDPSARVTNDWDYWGVGFRTGFSVDWFWGWNFYLTGQYTTAALVGRYDNDSKLTETDIVHPYRNTRYEDTRLVFNHQFMLGPSYQQNYDSGRFEIFVGYELNIWDNLHEVFRGGSGNRETSKNTIINRGLVGLHGATVRLTIDF